MPISVMGCLRSFPHVGTLRPTILINKEMASSRSIKPLDALQHASGIPLIMEAHVLHTYALEDWGYSFWISLEEGSFYNPIFGTLARPVEEEMSLLIK